jgi:hypothetical protein
MINLNVLAKKIAGKEGGRVSINIGQIKEVLSCALNLLSKELPSEVLKVLEKR